MKNNYLKISSLVTFLFILTTMQAQNFAWAKSSVGTGSGADEGISVSSDQMGNVFITGYFSSSTTSFGTTSLTISSGGTAIFLTKYDSNGNVLWAKSAGGTISDVGYSVGTDASGNVFVTGNFSSPFISFGTTTLTNTSGGNAVFLVKYDTNGSVLWAKSAGGSIDDVGYSVSSDAFGNVFVTGYFSSPSITFGTTTLTNSGGNKTVFIAKYDSNGNPLWAKSAGGTGSDISFSISTDALGNAYITGQFYSSLIAFGTYSLTNTGASCAVFIAKYDPSGNALWAKKVGGGGDGGRSICTDAFGNLFITGYFSSTNITFDTYTLTNTGVQNFFLTKYTSNGSVLWSKSAGGSNSDYGYSVSTYTSGLFVTGTFASPTITFGTTTLTPPIGSVDPMFIVNYDLNGNVICASALSSGGDDWSDVSVDSYGNAYITGDFMSNPFIVGSNTLTLTALEDVFITKYSCQTDAIGEISSNSNAVFVYPNPNNGHVKIKLFDTIENGSIILINSFGEKVHEQKISQGVNDIITHDLSQGLYYYNILLDTRRISNGKLTIE